MVTKKSITRLQLQNKTKKSKTPNANVPLCKKQKGICEQYNYFSETEFYPDNYIASLFAARGNWNRITKAELKTTTKPIHFMYINGKYYLEKYHYGVHVELKGVISDSRNIVADKSSLIRELSKSPIGRKYILETHDINAHYVMKNPGILSKYKRLFFAGDKGKTYILKPVSGYAGANIDIITTYQEFVTKMHMHIKKWGKGWRSGSKYYKEWVLQEYLSEPLLFRGSNNSAEQYKFHLRHYFIFRPGAKQSFFLKKGLMATGLKPYVKGYWLNKDIHDTHFHGREGEKFPAALNLYPKIKQYIYTQLYELYSVINKILKKHASCYAESRNCFEVFGADLMFTEDYKLKILEFNSSPGLGYEDQEYIPDEKKSVIENIMSIIIDDYFPPATKPHNSFADEVVFVK
jgi:hypothetical protein